MNVGGGAMVWALYSNLGLYVCIRFMTCIFVSAQYITNLLCNCLQPCANSASYSLNTGPVGYGSCYVYV